MKSIKDILAQRSGVYTVKSGTTIKASVDYMASQNIGIVPVLSEDGKLLGVFSERDLVKRVIAKNLSLESTLVEDVMTKDLILADIGESTQECLAKMKNRNTRHIIVIEGEKLAGILSMRDLLQIDLQIHEETIEILHNYIYAK
ncbi:MAG: CBS domain-containing protein [Melioribacteraceae bacterium]|nr:CBS domain-containing protein [Melioribacteraceae bacterium]